MTIVRDLMTTEPVYARADMPLTELVTVFSEHGVRGVPVLDEAMRLVGVVTETDLFLKDRGIPFSLERAPTLLGEFIDPDSVEEVERCRSIVVRDVMTAHPVSIGPQASLWDAAKMMTGRHVSLVPVTEDGRWVGTLRRVSILQRIYHT